MVIISVVLKPVGTGKLKVLQKKIPEEEVTTTPPGRVSVETPVFVGFASAVGRNVKVSPSVVITTVVLNPVGTGTVKVPQNKVPEAEVTVTPPKVSVETPEVGGALVLVEVGPSVEVKVMVLPPETVVITVIPVAGGPVLVPGAPIVEVIVTVFPTETVVIVVRVGWLPV